MNPCDKQKQHSLEPSTQKRAKNCAIVALYSNELSAELEKSPLFARERKRERE